MEHVDRLKEHTKRLINNEHRKARYYYARFLQILDDEFKKSHADSNDYRKELALERKLWSAFFALQIGEPEFHRVFLYLQYAVMLEQRVSMTDGDIPLSYKENKAMWYAIGKAEWYSKQGTLDTMTDMIKLRWQDYDKACKWQRYKQHHHETADIGGPSDWEK